MKLCYLIHEDTGRCPKCGGPTNNLGQTTTPDELVFPDKEGKWRINGKEHSADDLDQPDRTKPYKRVLKPRKPKDKHQGMMQALLRYRKEISP